MIIDLYSAVVIVAGMICLTVIWIVTTASRNTLASDVQEARRVAFDANSLAVSLKHRLDDLEKKRG